MIGIEMQGDQQRFGNTGSLIFAERRTNTTFPVRIERQKKNRPRQIDIKLCAKIVVASNK
jgi:hypothetical protein